MNETTSTVREIQAKRNEWWRIAGEGVAIEFVNNVFYGFCSELAALRLEHHYRDDVRAKAFLSPNKKYWVFKLDN